MRTLPLVVAAALACAGCCSSTPRAEAPPAPSGQPAAVRVPHVELRGYEIVLRGLGASPPAVPAARVPVSDPHLARPFLEGIGGCVLDRPEIPTILIPSVFVREVGTPFEVVVVPPPAEPRGND